MFEININLLAYLLTRMHSETRFNPETVVPISPCFSFAENAQSFVNVEKSYGRYDVLCPQTKVSFTKRFCE